MNEFGRSVRKYRLQSDFPGTGQPLTQGQLGELIGQELGLDAGLSAAAVSDWERGKSTINVRERRTLISLLRVLHRYGGLNTPSEANELLESGDYRSLNDTEQSFVFTETAGQHPAESAQKPGPAPDKRRTPVLMMAALIILAMLGLARAAWVWGITDPGPKTAVWQANLSPFDRSQWNEVSAQWQVAKPWPSLRENNPASYFGKAESELITANLDEYPILHFRVATIDPNTGLTFQVREPETSTEKNVLVNLTIIGDYRVNIAAAMGWHGTHSFTLNIWVSGESRSAAFDLIRIEAK